MGGEVLEEGEGGLVLGGSMEGVGVGEGGVGVETVGGVVGGLVRGEHGSGGDA